MDQWELIFLNKSYTNYFVLEFNELSVLDFGLVVFLVFFFYSWAVVCPNKITLENVWKYEGVVQYI